MTEEAIKALGETYKEEENKEDDLENLPASTLKELCKSFDLKMSGKKSELKEQIQNYLKNLKSTNEPKTIKDAFSKMKILELKEECKKYNLKVTGKEVELQTQLWEYLDAESITDDYLNMSLEDL